SGCLEAWSPSIAAEITARRSAGSSSSTGSGPRIAVSLLPSSPCSSTVRIETGTSAFSSPLLLWSPTGFLKDEGWSSDRDSAREARRAPVATASETSLTVPPRAFLIRLNSARGEGRAGGHGRGGGAAGAGGRARG